MSLTSPLLLTVVVIIAVLAMALGFDWFHPGWIRRLLIAVGVAVVVTGVLLVLHYVFHVVDYDFPGSFIVWVGLIVLAIALSVVSFGSGRRNRHHDRYGREYDDDDDERFRDRRSARWLRRSASVVAVPLTVLMALTLINGYFAYFPSFHSLFHNTNTPVTSLANLNAQRSAAKADPLSTSSQTGTSGSSETLQVTIPGTISHFNARPGYVWVPPAYVAGKANHLPVLMMLSGSLGKPDGWLQAGKADATAQAFADAHGGVAPIMVLPDENGSLTADTECVDGTRGNSETYLTQDVTNFMAANFGSVIDNRSWGAVGLSGGGECALMLSLRHPTLFSTFADFSGLTSPTPSVTVDPQSTADALFGGNLQTYYEHDPLHLLKQTPVPTLSGIFEVAIDDKTAYPAQQTMTALTKQVGMATCSWVDPDSVGHSFKLWVSAFQNALPLLSANLKLTPPETSGFPGTCTPASNS